MIEQAHEEHHPQQQRDQGSAFPEQMQHRNPRQMRFMHDELRGRRKRRLRVDQGEQLGDALHWRVR